MIRALALLLTLVAVPATAAPIAYTLNTEGSTVGFTYLFSGAPLKGSMPVRAATMRLDLANLPKSSVEVVLDPSGAKAGFAFATNAMKGADVLDTARFPAITFRSTRIFGDTRAATVIGQLTIRDVTRPVQLSAQLFRSRGSAETDLSNLVVLLTGTVNRNDFGAVGWPEFVGPKIDLRIIADIVQ